MKCKFRFCLKIAKHLHQSVISMGVKVLQPEWGLGAELPVLGDLSGFTTKIIHF